MAQSPYSIPGKTALIARASRNIGFAIAELFANKQAEIRRTLNVYRHNADQTRNCLNVTDYETGATGWGNCQTYVSVAWPEVHLEEK